jgi:hypothetical protein
MNDFNEKEYQTILDGLSLLLDQNRKISSFGDRREEKLEQLRIINSVLNKLGISCSEEVAR